MDKSIKGIYTPNPLSVTVDASLHDCVELMGQHHISSLIITENQKPIGIFTETDIVRTINLKLDFRKVAIKQLMSMPLITAGDHISAFDATYLLNSNNIRHLPIVNSAGDLVGITTQTDIIAHFGDEDFLGIRSVRNAMANKILTVPPTQSVTRTIKQMASHASDCAIVTDKDQAIGILTERDMATLIIKRVDLDKLTMAEVMTTPVITISQNSSTYQAVELMSQHKIRRVIVLDEEEKISGTLIQEDVIRNLEGNYIQFLKETLSEYNHNLADSQNAFKEKKSQLESLLHSSLGLSIIVTDRQFKITYINNDAEKTFNCLQQSCIRKPVNELLKCGAVHEHTMPEIQKQISQQGDYSFSHVRQHDSQENHFDTRITAITENGQVHGYILVTRNISDQLQTERSLRLASHVFESAIEGIMVTDTNGIIQSVNPAFTEITGYSAEEAIGKTPRLLHSDRQNREFYADMWQRLVTVGRWQGEIWNRRKSGQVYPERLSISSVRDSQGNITQYTAVFYDITDIKEQEERINHRAYHDPLTELPNRLLFKDRLGQAITRARRNETQLAVMFIDIDFFKRLNDTFGHQAGDEFLQIISMEFRATLREQDTVSRFAGDEFTVLLDGNVNRKNALLVAKKLLALFSTPFDIQGKEAYLGVSIGISIYPDDGNNPESLIQNADTAMYHAKESGRNNAQLFELEMETQVKERATLESELRKALGNDELTLRYQPIIDLHSKCITSMEALLRWDNAGNSVSPEQFIPIAEESGLIVPIGEWVLRQTCSQISEWMIDDVTGLAVSVNLSARQFREKELMTMIERILEETHISPQQLNLEITESSMMHDMPTSIETLKKLKQIGVRILMDDFGTGYSSLTCLQKFPVDVLKLDHTFIHDIEHDADAARLASGIIAMAKDLRLEVVAEGVETEAQLRFLEEHGCDKVQGYLFHKPLTEPELKKVLKAQRKNR